MEVNAIEAKTHIKSVMKAGLVAALWGSPAIGKSGIMEQIANEYNLELIDLRLSQCDPTDLMGYPNITNDRAGYVPMNTFPIAGDPLPAGKSGWLLFLDEVNSAAMAVQAASYKLILDKKVGQFNLHPNVAIVAAGNLATDRAIVNRMSTAMQSRMAHFDLIVDPKAWLKWAGEAGIDYRIRSFIGFKPEILYQFDPKHNGHTYPSPRTWEFMSNLIKEYKELPAEIIPLMASVVEEGAAREMFTYAQIFKDLITIPQIMANPTGIDVPSEPSIQYALAGSISQHITSANGAGLMTFLERLPIEFQVLALQGCLNRDKSLRQIPSITTWVKNFARELI